MGFVLLRSHNYREGLKMIPTKEDSYLRTVGGHYVAYSLLPGNPYSEWSFVSVICPRKPRLGSSKGWEPNMSITPYRTMTEEEISALQARRLLCFGMKVRGSDWVLVMCRPAIYCQHNIMSRRLSSSDGRQFVKV